MVSEKYAAEHSDVSGAIRLEGAENVYMSIYRTVDEGKAAILRFISMSDKDETVYVSIPAAGKNAERIKVIVPAKNFKTVKISL